ncbi:MAG: hypothetical protein JO129_00385 [Candidatus Dependentiae bacterium]|nr:hypothetical protein [Candidatus Dependentiae bacterium]
MKKNNIILMMILLYTTCINASENISLNDIFTESNTKTNTGSYFKIDRQKMIIRFNEQLNKEKERQLNKDTRTMPLRDQQVIQKRKKKKVSFLEDKKANPVEQENWISNTMQMVSVIFCSSCI